MPAFDATDIAKKYMTAIMDSMQNAAQINAAIALRGIIIEDPSTKGKSGNDATLASISNQFGADGNKLSGATFTYHEPDRRNREKERFLSNDLTDREQIALASIYFAAAVKAGENFAGNNEAMKYIDAIQVNIANAMRDTAFFAKSNPQGFEVDKDFADKIKILNENAPRLAQGALADAAFKDTLQAEFFKLSLQKKAILNHAGVNKPSELKGKDENKYKILSIITVAIDKFGQDYNMDKLAKAVSEAKTLDDQRPKGVLGKHKTSARINDLSVIVSKEVDRRQNAKAAPPKELSSLNTASTSRSGMFSSSSAGHSRNSSFNHANTAPPSEPPSPRKK